MGGIDLRPRLIAIVLGLGWLSGCAAASTTPTATGSEGALPASECPAIDLRSPEGEPVSLTGRWRSPDGATYYLRQSASCVWITGFSVDTGSPGGEGASQFTNAFFGHLASDFTFSGVWADMPWGRGTGVGTVTWKLDFADVDGEQTMTLTVIEVTNGVRLYLVQPEDGEVNLRVRLLDDSCATVDGEDGEDYDLVVTAPGWVFLEPPHLVGPNLITIQPLDEFGVSGEVARGTGDCGTGRVVFADQIEPLPAP